MIEAKMFEKLPPPHPADGSGASLPDDGPTRSSGTRDALPGPAPKPISETRWETLTLESDGLVHVPADTRSARGPIALREEATPSAFSHVFAALERITEGLSVIGVTSGVRGEGKTSVALHLARSAAKSSFQRVCLLDLSLGEDELCRRVGAAPSPGGVVTFLESDGPLAALNWPGPEQMSLYPAGKAPSNPAKTARSPRIASLIAALREEYDLVIVDLPAISTDNAAPIARHLDGCVVVVRAGATPRGLVNRAIETLGRENFVGVVLNRIERRRGANRADAA